MNDRHKAQFLVSENIWSIDATYKYSRISLYVPAYMCSYITHKDGQAVDYNLKKAKRELINKVLEDLMETEDWYEEDQNRHQGLTSGAGGND